jgi:putative ABC transport system permease protein
MFYSKPDNNNYLMVRIKGGDIQNTLSYMRKTWNNVIPDFPFVYSFLDDDFNHIYKAEERTGKLINHFAILAIFIAFLGLVGIISYMAEQRTREIGIRKVQGASTGHIFTLMIKEFFVLVAISNVIAWPVCFFVMNRWLSNFAYRTSLDIWSFVLAAAIGFFIMFLSTGYRVFKAARTNPIETLGYE